jgi:hypothetical protein
MVTDTGRVSVPPGPGIGAPVIWHPALPGAGIGPHAAGGELAAAVETAHTATAISVKTAVASLPGGCANPGRRSRRLLFSPTLRAYLERPASR